MGENPVRVSVVFTCNEPNRPSWPYINYDCEGRAERIMETLCRELPDFNEEVWVDFKGRILDSPSF